MGPPGPALSSLNPDRFLSDTAAPHDPLDEPRLSEEHGVALQVARLAAPVLRDLGFRLVRIKISAQDGATLQVMAERPDGTMDVDGCEAISEALSPVLDVEDPVKTEYRLEISSPGIDRPLMRVSDFRRAVGFEAKVEMSRMVEGRKRFRGRLDAVDDDSGVPILCLTRFDGKPGDPEVVRLSLADVEDGRLVLTDDLIRESLRAAKAAEKELAEQSGGEGSADEAAPDGALPAPAKGPGRFAARNAARQAKTRPILPAGVRAGFKARPGVKAK